LFRLFLLIPCWESQRLIPKRSAGPRAENWSLLIGALAFRVDGNAKGMRADLDGAFAGEGFRIDDRDLIVVAISRPARAYPWCQLVS
jgi:hypothetical protein